MNSGQVIPRRPGDGRRLDMLGVWALPVESPGIAFSGGPGAPAAPQSWQMELPVDPASASDVLAAGRARLELTGRALDRAETRFEALASALARSASTPGVSFDAEDAAAPLERLPDAENLLLVRLGVLQQTQGMVSYGLDLTALIPADLTKMMADGQALLEQISRFLSLFASVDTFIGDRFVARTEVAWSGAARTVWRERLTPEQAALHARLLDLTLRTRETWLRVAALVVRLAARLATLLASPINIAFLVPAVWGFIQEIRTELENLEAANNQIDNVPATG